MSINSYLLEAIKRELLSLLSDVESNLINVIEHGDNTLEKGNSDPISQAKDALIMICETDAASFCQYIEKSTFTKEETNNIPYVFLILTRYIQQLSVKKPAFKLKEYSYLLKGESPAESNFVFPITSNTIDSIAFLVKRELSYTKSIFEEFYKSKNIVKEQIESDLISSLSLTRDVFKIINFTSANVILDSLLDIPNNYDLKKHAIDFAKSLILIESSLWGKNPLKNINQSRFTKIQAIKIQEDHYKETSIHSSKIAFSKEAHNVFINIRNLVNKKSDNFDSFDFLFAAKKIDMLLSIYTIMQEGKILDALFELNQAHLHINKALDKKQKTKIYSDYLEIIVIYEIIFEQLQGCNIDEYTFNILISLQKELHNKINFDKTVTYNPENHRHNKDGDFIKNEPDLKNATPNIDESPYINKSHADESQGLKSTSLKENKVDKEFLDIFIEEGRDISGPLRSGTSKLKNEYHNKQIIIDLRRYYHTLKGSSRMIGLNDFGEFAWQHESLLNYIISKEIVINDTIYLELEIAAEIVNSTFADGDFKEKTDDFVKSASVAESIKNSLLNKDKDQKLSTPNENANSIVKEISSHPALSESSNKKGNKPKKANSIEDKKTNSDAIEQEPKKPESSNTQKNNNDISRIKQKPFKDSFDHSDFLNEIYNREKKLDPEKAPPWTWELLATLEETVLKLNKKELAPSNDEHEKIKDALKAVEQYQLTNEEQAKIANNNIMNLLANIPSKTSSVKTENKIEKSIDGNINEETIKDNYNDKNKVTNAQIKKKQNDEKDSETISLSVDEKPTPVKNKYESEKSIDGNINEETIKDNYNDKNKVTNAQIKKKQNDEKDSETISLSVDEKPTPVKNKYESEKSIDGNINEETIKDNYNDKNKVTNAQIKKKQNDEKDSETISLSVDEKPTPVKNKYESEKSIDGNININEETIKDNYNDKNKVTNAQIKKKQNDEKDSETISLSVDEKPTPVKNKYESEKSIDGNININEETIKDNYNDKNKVTNAQIKKKQNDEKSFNISKESVTINPFLENLSNSVSNISSVIAHENLYGAGTISPSFSTDSDVSHIPLRNEHSEDKFFLETTKKSSGSTNQQGPRSNNPSSLDKSILDVFLDEASGIVKKNQKFLDDWKKDFSNLGVIQNIQRGLHTLKGGARMSGLSVLGDLSHYLESLLTYVVDGKIKDHNKAFYLLSKGTKLSSDMISLLESSQTIYESPEYIESLDDFIKKETGASLGYKRSIVDAPTKKLTTKASLPKDTHKKAPYSLRVSSDSMEQLSNLVGESSITRAKLERSINQSDYQLDELSRTIVRTGEQLRRLESETEAQILFHHKSTIGKDDSFDPLELDRFSEIQQLSRLISESMEDLQGLKSSLFSFTEEAKQLIADQTNIQREIQNNIISISLIRFDSIKNRIKTLIRQASKDVDKKVSFKMVGENIEIERKMIEEILPGLEHAIRNSIAHGIETKEGRVKLGKDPRGTITLGVKRDGADLSFTISDDGRGANLDAIKEKARKLNMLREDLANDKDYLMQLMFEPGFSTAKKTSQLSGRGIGLDVLRDVVDEYNGSIEVENKVNKGLTIFIKLPFTISITGALPIKIGKYNYAVPIMSIEGIVRIENNLYQKFKEGKETYYDYGQNKYLFKNLVNFFDPCNKDNAFPFGVPVLLVRAGNRRVALKVSEIGKHQEIIIKSINNQFTSLPGIIGATILENGQLVPVMEIRSLGRWFLRIEKSKTDIAGLFPNEQREENHLSKIKALVVDDSSTMRKVNTRVLEKHKFNVVTAKDGLDALDVIDSYIPDFILLDIEMPRMDGFELATHIRNSDKYKDIPIIMITSRSGKKHRDKAKEIGVNDYLGKPYTEDLLISAIEKILKKNHKRQYV